MAYDTALTVFSPDGHLFQVEYAEEAVRRGIPVVGVRSKKLVLIAYGRQTTPELQDPRTIRKVYNIDEHIFMAFSGLNADARVLSNEARLEAQSHRLNLDDPPTVEMIARHVAYTQQKYTQSGGRRPFGVSTLLAGIDPNGTPRLFHTQPSGIYNEWVATAIGGKSDDIRELLEAEYEQVAESEPESIEETKKLFGELAIKALDKGAHCDDIGIVAVYAQNGKPVVEHVSKDIIDALVKIVEEKKREQEEKARQSLIL
ncbi:Proteasome subunit alpha type-7 [Mycoemilia scoparia]|uniref:Proteasome subunit alpha type n=1 Tax=Mycoemilia scoparia TaxID=417184 RepID=A0A9W8DWD6_9FUNG|nr:Proteasome subunit alpha type-7 [Mycoemilia scoparia]